MPDLPAVARILLLQALGSLVAVAIAGAQGNMGDVLKSVERAAPGVEEKKPPGPVIEGKGAAPTVTSQAGAKKVLVKRFTVTGNTLLDQASLDAVIAPFQGKELTIAEISGVAEAVTAKYRERGYIIAYALVPQQEIKDGEVSIRVVEGKVGQVTVVGNRHYGTGFLENRFRDLRPGTTVTQSGLEKPLLLLNELSGLYAKASLKAGKDPGTTDVVVQVKDSVPLSGSLSFDNYGSRSTSKTRLTGNLSLGNAVVDGDSIGLTGLTGLDTPNFSDLVYAKADYSLPLGSAGTRAGVYYGHSHFEAQDVPKKGKADVAGLSLNVPVVRERTTTVDAWLGFDVKDVKDYGLSGGSEDRVRMLKLGFSFDGSDRFFGRNFVGVGAYLGLGRFLGGTWKGTREVSRAGSDDSFQKFTVDLSRFQTLPGHALLILKGSAQYSNDSLFAVEQFSIGGQGTVRGQDLSKLNGDTGYVASAEVNLSPFFPETEIRKNWRIGDAFKIALFFDYGRVFRNSTESGEKKAEYLSGAGMGARFYAPGNFSVKYDFAVPVSSAEVMANRIHYLQFVWSY